MTSNSLDDRLLLSFSHAPLPTDLLDSLIDKTTAECNAMFDSIDNDRKKIEENKEEKKDSFDNLQQQQLSKKIVVLHVLTTGTPYVIKPGKSQPDYIQQWTKGEKILARLVDKIGMDKFHRVPKDGETKLAGRLIDVKPSDFEFLMTHGNNKQDLDEGKPWSDDCLREELTWIADNILRMLVIDQRPNIGVAKILFPLDPRFEHVHQDDIKKFVEGIFCKEWSNTKGPLYGAQIEVVVVKEN